MVEAYPRVVSPETFKVPVAVIFATLEMFPEIRALPWTDNFCDGDVVPMPTDPLSRTWNKVVEALLTKEKSCPAPVPEAQRENLEYGEDVPIANLELSVKSKVAESKVVAPV